MKPRLGSHGLTVLLLLPALTITLGLFAAAVVLLAGASLSPATEVSAEHEGLTLEAFRSLARHPELMSGALLSLRIAALSTVLSASLGFGVALAFRESGARWRTAFQAVLPVPYVVAALAILWTLSPSGWIARLVHGAGLLVDRSAFPIVVQDTFGLGIVLAYGWKATPFVAMVVLAALDTLDHGYEASARSLGAGRVLRLKSIVWPHVRPSLLAASALVFVFTFGALEVPLILGARSPSALPLIAHRLFAHPDLMRRPLAFALALVITTLSMAILVCGYAVFHIWRNVRLPRLALR